MNKQVRVEVTKWGLIITLSGRICRHDLEVWNSEFAESILSKLPRKFHLLLNLIDVEPICQDTAKIMVIAQAYLLGRGLQRSAIIYDSSSKLNDLNRALINASSFSKYARYISIYTHANYLKLALNWLLKGIEP
jgi:hypothetical protein